MPRKAFDRPVIWLTGTALLILLGTVLLSYQDWLLFREASTEARHSRDVLESTASLLAALKDAETGQRGFLLTNDQKYLKPYRDALNIIPGGLKQLQQLVSHDEPASGPVKRLPPLIAEKWAELQRTIDVQATQGTAAAIEIVRTDRGREVMDEIRRLCSEIDKSEYALLIERRTRFEVSGSRTRLLTTLGSATLFVLIVFAGAMLSAAAVRREQLIEDVQASEKRAAEARDLIQTTLSSIGDAVIATDIEGKVTFINPVAQALTGYTQPDAAGQPLEKVFHIVNESTRQPVESPVAKVLRDGTVVGLANHTALISRSGVETPIDDSGAPIRDGNGAVVGVVLVFRDITERKKAEEDVRQLASIVSFSGRRHHLAASGWCGHQLERGG